VDVPVKSNTLEDFEKREDRMSTCAQKTTQQKNALKHQPILVLEEKPDSLLLMSLKYLEYDYLYDIVTTKEENIMD